MTFMEYLHNVLSNTGLKIIGWDARLANGSRIIRLGSFSIKEIDSLKKNEFLVKKRKEEIKKYALEIE